MKLTELEPMGTAYRAQVNGVESLDTTFLRLETPRGPTWYSMAFTGFELCSDEVADNLEEGFKQRMKETA